VPDLFTECAFATAQALVAGVTASGGDTFPENLIPALEGLTFEGPKGTYFIQPGDHQALVPMYIAELVSVDDPDFMYYSLLQTIPAMDIIPPCNLPEEYADRCDLNASYVEEMMMMDSE
jgi:branched-chain amino acid transport system substrate-binding protein